MKKTTGEGSVAAGPVGRHASAGTDWKMNTEMLTYSRSRAVFSGLALEGAVVQQDNDSTHAIYRKHMMFRNILSGKAATPRSADAFLKARIRGRPTGKYGRSRRRHEVAATGGLSHDGFVTGSNHMSVPAGATTLKPWPLVS